MTDEILASMIERVIAYKDAIVVGRILPRVRWTS
jgi:hypothetical protein